MQKFSKIAAGAAGLALAAGLTACGGAHQAAPAPNAWAIARKIPGCHLVHADAATGAGAGDYKYLTRQDLECANHHMPGNAVVEIATFRSASLERQWVGKMRYGVWTAMAGHGWVVSLDIHDTPDASWLRYYHEHVGGRVEDS